MSNETQLNLDRLAAQHAQKIIQRAVDEDNESDREKKKRAGNVDSTVTKGLGVLQENGVYACFLYLLAKEGDNGGVVVEEMLDVLDGLRFGWGKPADKSTGEVLSYITDKVTVDLERLLLAKETLEQVLIYARYGAKARS